jgi:two-component system, chemotaxis family, sensor kinase CheA
MAKYRRIFLEEATDHLGEMSHALLGLEKELAGTESIDTLFRMAHSIKSMAASLGFEPIADLAHKMEDRMEGVRRTGRVRDPAELAVLFQALEALEGMVAAVAAERNPNPADDALLARLGVGPAAEEGSTSAPADLVAAHPKKALS